MALPAPVEAGYTGERYFGLVADGVLRPDDRVELLDGVIVAMPPQDPAHAFAVMRLDRVLQDLIGTRASIRVQLPFIAGTHSVPEPDIAVVPGPESRYAGAHPSAALLIVEVADSSLIQDRLTKAPIYAGSGVPEYWLVNLRDGCVEVFRSPQPEARRYVEKHIARRGERVELAALAGVSLAVDDLLPS